MISPSRLIGAGALVASALFAAPASGSSLPPLPTGVGCEAHSQVRPSQVVLSCADDNSYFGSIHWASWSPTSATGTGRFMLNPCSPNCAESTVADRGTVRLVASAPSSSNGRRAFTRLRVTRISTRRSVTLTWAWASSLTQIGGWRGSTAPLLSAG